MRKIVVLVLSLLILINAAACQATPEKDIVVEKNLENMMEKATQTVNGTEAQAQGTSLAEKLGALQTYKTDLSDAKGKVNIHVDADVQIPEVSGVSVQRVERGKITQAQVDVLISQLMGGGNLVSGDAYQLTKSEIQKQIVEIEAAKLSAPSDDMSASLDDGAKNPKQAGMLDAKLAELKELLKTAPDTRVDVPIDGKLQPMTQDVDYATGDKLYALVETAQGDHKSLRVYNYAKEAGNFIRYTSEKNTFPQEMSYFSTEDEIKHAEAQGYSTYISSEELAQIPKVTISEDDAKAKAEALITALGIGNMTCYSSDIKYGGSYDRTPDQKKYANPHKSVWFLRYGRSVSGVTATYTPWDCIKVEKDAQAAPWPYEDMTFAIDDSGIVGFEWKSPYLVTDTVTENSNVISFDDVTKVFGTMALAVNAWDGLAAGSPNLKSMEIKVDHIKFGLTRITEENKRDSGLLVPVWDFLGTMTYVAEVGGKTKRYDDSGVPILTINAIDGSIINRSLGY